MSDFEDDQEDDAYGYWSEDECEANDWDVEGDDYYTPFEEIHVPRSSGNNIILHPGQSEVFNAVFIDKTCLNAVAVCARGWGKSFFAGVAAATGVSELLTIEPSVPHKNIYVIAPTYSQVTDIYFPLLAYELGLEAHVLRMSKDKGRFWFPNKVELRLISYEAVDRLRGTGAYLVINDEVRDWTSGAGLKTAWESVIQPCIKTRWSKQRAKQFKAPSPGRSITISTTKGYDYLYDMFNHRESNKEWQSWQFDYTSSPYLDPVELEQLKSTVDPLTWIREFLAQFEDSGNNVFYCFNRKIHVLKEISDFARDKDGSVLEDVHIGIDFNVGLQCSSVFAVRGNQMFFLDEFKGHPDTDGLAKAIVGRYWPNYHKDGIKTCNIFVYPDPTGNARKTSAVVGVTDFTILAKHGLIVRARSKSPPIVDSANAVNRMLKSAAGTVNMYVLAKCKGIIDSMQRTVWLDGNPDTATIDKEKGDEHFSDGVRYATEYLYPIKRGGTVAVRGVNF